MSKDLPRKISNSIHHLEDSEEVKGLINEAISNGIPPVKIVEEGIRKGLEMVGKKYEKGEYFLSELIFAGDLAEEAFETLNLESGEEGSEFGTIVLGTVQGDVHDVGKNIFATLMKAEGFQVIDLDTDVDPQRFIQALRKHDANILGMSCLLTTTISQIERVVESLENEEIRDEVKVIIGGNAVNDEVAEDTGVDAAALQAVNGVEICKKWMEEKA